MNLCGNGTMVMVMSIIIVFLLVFVGSLEDQNKYPNLHKPYDLHIHLEACPKCEAWCANNSRYTCDYSCDEIQEGNYSKLGKNELERKLSYEQENAYQNKMYGVDLHFTSFENETTLNQICGDEKTYNCIFDAPIYPVCTLDYKPYDKGMKDCCQLLKKCTEPVEGFANKIASIFSPNIRDGCGKENARIHKNAIKKFPRGENPKYWAFCESKYAEESLNFCTMQCTNGRLVHNNRSQSFPPTTTKKTTFSTKTNISPTKLTTSKNFPQLSNLTAKVDKTEAISQVIVGFLGINFVVVGAAIVAVIAELF